MSINTPILMALKRPKDQKTHSPKTPHLCVCYRTDSPASLRTRSNLRFGFLASSKCNPTSTPQSDTSSSSKESKDLATMVWKTRDTHYLTYPCELVEVIETAAFADLEIFSSASSFEVVYDLGKVPPLPTDSIGRRRVLFSPDNEYFPNMNRSDITSEEKQMMWFRKSELKRMRRRFDDGERDEDDGTIQHLDPPENDGLQEALHQLMAVSVVLDEQTRQKKEQMSDPTLISQKYRSFMARSRRSLFIANLVKAEDQKKIRLRRPLRLISDDDEALKALASS